MSKKSWVAVVLLAIAAGTYEATMGTLLPSPWREFRPIIDVTILLVILNRPKGAFATAAIAGLILDAYSSGGGVFSFARLLLVTTAVFALSETVLTNRSMYATAALVVTARLIDRVWVWAAHAIGANLFRWDIPQEPFTSFFITVIWDVATVSLVFVLLAFFTRRFLVTVARPNRFYDR